MNRIVKVELHLIDGNWRVDVTKEFAPEHGGGFQTFSESGGPQIHNALRHAAAMVTVTPTRVGHDPGNAGCPRNADPRNESCDCGGSSE